MANTYTIISAPASPLATAANSYNTLISLSQASRYLNVKPGNGNWSSLATDDLRMQYIIMVTFDINDLLATICERLFTNTYYNQFLCWPFKATPNIDGTVTTLTNTTKFIDINKLKLLKTYDILNGSLVITNTSNNLAPQYECVSITGYNESTCEITHEAFTTALEVGDSYKLVYPVPSWLLICMCEQILYRCNSLRHEGYADKFVSGISSEGGMQDKTIQLHDPGSYGHLCSRSASVLKSLASYTANTKRFNEQVSRE